MRIYDLSHTLNNKSPVYPGTGRPQFEPAASIEKDGYRETRLSFYSHLGTHIDAPAHMLEWGKTLDRLPPDTFTGRAFIISLPANILHIEKDFLLPYEKTLMTVDFVLFNTGWSKFWGTPGYFEGFPTLTDEAAEWLLHFPLKGIGTDAISVDPVESISYVNHFKFLNRGMILIENLKFSQELHEDTGDFSCFPLPFENADGSPVRAIFRVKK